MQTTTLDNLEQHLDALNLPKNVENIIIHSSLISFGRISAAPEEIYALIRSKIASDATVFAPSFTLNLAEEDVFNATETPSYGMGILSEYIRTLPGAIRANNPMHSYCAIGPNARILEQASESLSFGPQSCFERMLTLDPHLLLLGCPFHNGATHIHQVEAELGVPYRIWVNLKRNIQKGGKEQLTEFKYYGIDRALEVNWTPQNVLNWLIEEDKVIEQKLPYGKSYLLKLSDLDFASQTVLKQDNNALNILP